MILEMLGLAITGSVLAYVAMADWAEMRQRMAQYRRRSSCSRRSLAWRASASGAGGGLHMRWRGR